MELGQQVGREHLLEKCRAPKCQGCLFFQGTRALCLIPGVREARCAESISKGFIGLNHVHVYRPHPTPAKRPPLAWGGGLGPLLHHLALTWSAMTVRCWYIPGLSCQRQNWPLQPRVIVPPPMPPKGQPRERIRIITGVTGLGKQAGCSLSRL